MPWRQRLLEYNTDHANELGLKQAADLYSNSAYRALVDKIGLDRTFILSAGWGLIRSDFLTPRYDITFSASAPPYARRRKTDRYDDFCMLPSESREPIPSLEEEITFRYSYPLQQEREPTGSFTILPCKRSSAVHCSGSRPRRVRIGIMRLCALTYGKNYGCLKLETPDLQSLPMRIEEITRWLSVFQDAA